MRIVLVLATFLLIHSSTLAQSSAFGVKGGLTMGFQQWNGIEQDPLFKYHGIVFIESYDDVEDRFAIFAQAGYHIKGSALRNTRFNLTNGNIYNLPAREFQFRNISLTLGGKQKFPIQSGASRYYYMIGLRGEYTVNTNLSEYESANTIFFSFFPTDVWVNKFNYGVTVGGGLEFPLGELVGGMIEFTVNPDLSRQYRQPPLENIPNPYFPGQNRTIQERLINNIALEFSFGIRLLRIVEYIDPNLSL